MDRAFKKVVGLQAIPAVINIAGAVFVFLNFDQLQFTGYVIGALLGVILSIGWVMQESKTALHPHAIKLLKITFKGLFVKVIIFLIFMTIVYAFFEFSKLFFVISFFIALFISAIVEIWYYTTLIKKGRLQNP